MSTIKKIVKHLEVYIKRERFSNFKTIEATYGLLIYELFIFSHTII